MEVYNVKMLHYYNGVVDTHIYSHAIESGVKVDEKKKKRKRNNVKEDKEKNEQRSITVSLNRTKQKVQDCCFENILPAEEIHRIRQMIHNCSRSGALP